MKRLTFIICATIFLASCTGMLWDRRSYEENIHSLYIEEKSNSFVVLGSSFHYVFQAEKELINVLKASQEIQMSPVFYPFSLSNNNDISGKFTLYAYKRKISSDEVSRLKGLGFDDSRSYNNELLKYEVSIHGSRYNIDSSVELGRNFSKAYQVTILEPRSDSAVELAGKALVTPVTIAADAVLVIFGGVLYGITFN